MNILLENLKKIKWCFTTFSIFETKVIRDANINFLPRGMENKSLPGDDTGYQMIEKLDEDRSDILNYKRGRKKRLNILISQVFLSINI